MRKNKLELLMSLLILLAAWVLSREAAQTAVSADAVKNGAQTFVVVIDAGHGGEDPGKVSGSGTLEKDINLAIALRLERMLQAADVKTVMTRRADEGLDSRKNGSKKVEVIGPLATPPESKAMPTNTGETNRESMVAII